jgi:predicted short-subunit dehydrogenase-like oxidoreductase (DUF2520 family)
MALCRVMDNRNAMSQAQVSWSRLVDKDFQSVGFLGAGRTASALALGMSSVGFNVTTVASRSFDSARTLAAKIPGCDPLPDPFDLVQRCDVVFLTVPDDAIASVAEMPWRAGQGIVHCSGALSVDVLAPFRTRGVVIGALHPFLTFASLDTTPTVFSVCTFAVEGDGPLQTWLEGVVSRLGGDSVHISPADRPLYHASAVLACGYVTTLLDAAGQLWDGMGFPRDQSLRALLTLVDATLRNAQDVGTHDGLTGPIVRGDAGTVRLHVEALAQRAPSVLALYCQTGLAMVALASKRGSIGPDQAQRMANVLESYLVPASPEIQTL